MRGCGIIEVIVLPYRNFKEKIRFTKCYLGKYHIEDLGGILYMERAREENGRA